MLFIELSEYFTANSLSSQFKFSFCSLLVYDQLAICYLKLGIVVQPRSMGSLGCQAQNHCTSTTYSKWNYFQLNLKYILLPIIRKASRQDIATTFRVAWRSLHFTLIMTITAHWAMLWRETDTDSLICSTWYRFRHKPFPTVKTKTKNKKLNS